MRGLMILMKLVGDWSDQLEEIKQGLPVSDEWLDLDALVCKMREYAPPLSQAREPSPEMIAALDALKARLADG